MSGNEMVEHVKPSLYCSRCLEFDHCRYDGTMISSHIVALIREHADIVHDCPEMGIGLGVPRSPVKVYEDREGYHLYQSATERDHTERMEEFVDSLLERNGDVDGFILKAKSPSCGMDDVKIHSSRGKGGKKRMGSGFLGRMVQEKKGHLAVETEKRLLDETIRDHFLTKLFTLARFRKVRDSKKARDLVDFHSRHKYLLMAYNQAVMREMGRVVSDQKELGIENALKRYFDLLCSSLDRGARYTSHINVLTHCYGYVSSDLGDQERRFFADSIEMYRDDRIPLTSLKTMIKSWSIRFNVEYLLDQYYFEPYPMDLVSGFDTKRDRELWK